MVILHVVRQYYPSIGGFEEVVRNLCKQQQALGHQPHIVTLNRYFKELDTILPAEEVIDGVPVRRIPFWGSTRYPLAFSILKYIGQADVVHVHGIDFFYDYLALTKVIHRKKLVATTHGGFFHTNFASGLKKVFFKTITRFSGAFYKKIIASSENDADIFQAIIPHGKLVTIENGVDIDKLYIKSKEKFPPTLLYFGRWSENKGIQQMLHVFQKLCSIDSDTNWQLMLAGRPYDLSVNDVESMVDSLGLSSRVTIIQSPDTETLKGLTTKASYFISMSQFEGFGIAPIEAMSAGLTPVLSAIPPFHKLVNRSSGLGIIIDEVTDKSVSQIINHYHDKQFDVNQLHDTVKQYAWVDVNKQYMEAYLD